MYDIKTKNLSLELKALSETGEFEGLAAVYGIRDEVGDVIERGAFTRTLQHKGGKVPIFWQHQVNEVLGIGILTDSDEGLWVKGKLNLDVARAREVHSLMKQAKAEMVPFGLSIGYDTLKADWKGDTRFIKEARLWEVSPTIFPAQPLATVASIKQRGPSEGKPFGEYEDFADCVSKNQDKENPEGYCAWLHHEITGEWPTTGASLWPTRVAAMFARTPEIKITREQMTALCPSCAEEMVRRNLTALRLAPSTVKQMPEQLLAGLCDKFGADEGFFTRCVDGISGTIDDPESFCAWLHQQCHGTWPGEKAALPLLAARHLLGEAASILETRGLAEVAARAREIKALLETDSGIFPSAQDPAAEVALWVLLRQVRDDARHRLNA